MEIITPLYGVGESLDLLRENCKHHIAFVGGGGKTTLLHALGEQLKGKVILTTTTKMGADQHKGLETLLDPTSKEIQGIKGGAPVMIWKEIRDPKAIGVEKSLCDEWFSTVDHVLVEADGSRKRPFKAPAGYEPVIPHSITLMISTIGGDALGRVIADQCHRPLRVAALAECGPYQRLTPARAAKVLLSERGNRKELPEKSKMQIVVTKVTDENLGFVQELEECIYSIDQNQQMVAIAFEESVERGWKR
ncbi:MAG: selenium cofactor biosynthesis protein YqeC [Acidimicrobiales bacterium]|nr:selenium cofactor biosynthesis protein YqeC [Acidimicrobiales bacterium]HJM97596.1 selenium cofactor biosynthesis protein YqeC [Acidimicrobiales bacterium]